jgi:hypothetical protein
LFSFRFELPLGCPIPKPAKPEPKKGQTQSRKEKKEGRKELRQSLRFFSVPLRLAVKFFSRLVQQ